MNSFFIRNGHLIPVLRDEKGRFITVGTKGVQKYADDLKAQLQKDYESGLIQP